MLEILRDYQIQAENRIFQVWESGVRSALVVLPTGSGKTVLIASVVKRMQPQRAIIFAHREELIWQTRDKIERYAGLQCDIEMGEIHSVETLFGKSPVVVSTIQTQVSKRNERYRMSKFKPDEFGLVIIDECHHSTARTYQNVANYYLQNPKSVMLGVTATPDRADEEALGQIFQEVAFDYEVLDAINDGWLVPVNQQMVHIHGLDFSGIKTTDGDLNSTELAEVMENERNLFGVAGASMTILNGRKAIVFCASVAQAEALSDIFNRYQKGLASWVCGKTPKEDRRKLLCDFRDGKVRIVCNCGVLTEGFDEPSVEVVVMARPTKSRALYSQMCGRSMRPLPGIVDGIDDRQCRKLAIGMSEKRNCLIVDFIGNSGRHKLVTTADILGGKASDDAIERAIARAKKLGEKGKAARMTELIQEEEEKILQLEAKERERLRKLMVVAKANYKTEDVDPFDTLDIRPTRSRGWDYNKQLSDKQKGFLLKQGINPVGLQYSQAQQLIIEIMQRWKNKMCSFKQAKLLKKFGYSDVNVSAQQAKEILDKVAAAGWKRPDDALSRTT